MNKHFLITVSNDAQHLTGVMFVSSFFKQISEHKVTLLHVCRLDSNTMNKTLMESWQDPQEKLSGKISIGARKALNKATQLLSQSNMKVDQVLTKTCAERFGKIKDILNEAREGLYDAIILGKRASYTFQWLFERPADEVPKGMLNDNELNTPLWICPEVEQGRKNVLICVDGSDSALRAVDHVGYILSKEDHQNITLLHVGSDSQQAAAIFSNASKILQEHNISANRVSTKTTQGLSVSGTILKVAHKGKFSAIAIGLRGRGKRQSKQKGISGATASDLVTEVDNISLWCVP